ncbi:hypothetical protein GCM10025865_07790 [Paraoerskovia sediminicola]|uniref:AB hydrolase-1 domain-containing protein n=1 Tax=Paraoerskovia sediminicola TaxID=1138587 RepID=A0ABM8G0A2_9CELL|nr:alpha/beta hydrolase [Paraoerskovia sediminicola]BDZ41480.1 hypothetical protein GCM10025865_07790 [Paraoerskovia sediminicola]
MILPGLALAPSDYDQLVEVLRRDGIADQVRVLDAWNVPITGPVHAIRRELGIRDGERLGVIGHSAGGLTALEWTLRHPDEVADLVMLDPTTPFGKNYPVLHPDGHLDRFARWAIPEGAPDVVGGAARQLGFRTVGGVADTMSDDEVRARYGDVAQWPGLWGQFTHSWAHERAVGELWAQSPDRLTGLVRPPLHLVAMQALAGTSFLRDQRDLAVRSGADVWAFRRHGHLFPLIEPDVVAQAVRGERPAGAHRPRFALEAGLPRRIGVTA